MFKVSHCKKNILFLTFILLSISLLKAQNNNLSWRLSGNNVTENEFIGTLNSESLIFKTNGKEGFRLLPNGNIVIGAINTEYKLEVCGKIRAEEIIVEPQWWPDYVFNKDYQLQPFKYRINQIKKEKSLPGIPSEQEILTNGANVNEVLQGLLKNVEELYLYIEILENRIYELEKNKMQEIN